MESEAPLKLAVIDFTRQELMKPGAASWATACGDVRKALEKHGCFVAIYDKVSSELHASFFSATKELFDLPKEVKIRCISDTPFLGYLRPKPNAPLLQSMAIGDVTTAEAVRTFTNTMWPAGNERFCKTLKSYTETVAELEEMVHRMIFESYGVDKYYESHVGPLTHFLRVQKYRVPRTNETDLGIPAHTDKSMISILDQNQVDGLEVEMKGGKWIPVQFPPSSFFVMAGNGLTVWSNGRIVSALHRVIMRGKEARYSAGVFSYHMGILKAPEELVDAEHPLQFKPCHYSGFLRFFFKEKGFLAPNPIKAYCGI